MNNIESAVHHFTKTEARNTFARRVSDLEDMLAVGELTKEQMDKEVIRLFDELADDGGLGCDDAHCAGCGKTYARDVVPTLKFVGNMEGLALYNCTCSGPGTFAVKA